MSILRRRETWQRTAALPPPKTKSTPYLTAEERQHVRAAIKALLATLGSFDAVSDATGVNRQTLKTASSRNGKPAVGVALCVARAAGVPLESVLSGAWPPCCPTCKRPL